MSAERGPLRLIPGETDRRRPKSPRLMRFGPRSTDRNATGDAGETLPTPHLVSLISAKTKLTRRGRDWWGCCPLHGEKTPSFHVYETRRKWMYHCFGCGESGDSIDWIRRTQNVGYKEALQILQLPAPKPDPEIEQRRKARQQRQRALDAYHDRAADCSCPDWLIAT